MLCVALCGAPLPVYGEQAPSMRSGLAKIIWGMTMELPTTVVDATLTNPPVIGTAVGLLAGVARAVQKTFEGMAEFSEAFTPWDW